MHPVTHCVSVRSDESQRRGLGGQKASDPAHISGRSAVCLAHPVWDRGVPGWNPGAPTKIKGFLQQENSKTEIRKDVWVRVPQRRQLPMAKLVDALVIKTETRKSFGIVTANNNNALLTPWSWVRVPPLNTALSGTFRVAQLVEQVNNTIPHLVQ